MKRIGILLIITQLTACSVNQPKKIIAQNSHLHDPLTLALQPESKVFEIDPKRDTALILNDRGTKLKIPSYSFVDLKGNTVSTKVSISFKEYTNSADIAFSGIHMQYKQKGEELYFNSSGMFELAGKTKGSQINIREGKSLSLDYSLTQNVPNTDFYKLNKENTGWELIQKIPTLKETLAPINKMDSDSTELLDFSFEDPSIFPEMAKFKGVSFKIVSDKKIKAILEKILFYQIALEKTAQYGIYTMKLAGYDEDANFNVFSFEVKPVFKGENYLQELKKYELSFNKAEKETLKYMKALEDQAKRDVLKMESENLAYEKQLLYEKKLNEELLKQQAIREAEILRTNPPAIFPESTDSGHTYPAIVKNLSIESFGIFNCDQLYRFKNKTQINALYIDEKGKEITNGHVLSVIDLSMRSAFSFNPKNITFDQNNNFVLALFTKDQKLYIIRGDQVPKMTKDQNGQTILQMNDMSKSIQSAEDLRSFLRI